MVGRKRASSMVGLSLIAFISMILITPSSMGYFWTDDPMDFGHHIEPPEDSLDGCGESVIMDSNPTLSAFLAGGPSIMEPDKIYYGNFTNLSLMFVTTYVVTAWTIGATDTYEKVTLTLFFDEAGGPFQWVEKDEDFVIASTNWPLRTSESDQGWLYVWHDVSYEDEDAYKLVLKAQAFYYEHGQWNEFGGSPVTATVYFTMHES